MTDSQYIQKQFYKENAEKKRIAHGAQHQVKANRGPVKMPSDYLSIKEKRKLNGEVLKIDMNRPVTWASFKKWSTDLQKDYLNGLVEKYNVPYKQISLMLGCKSDTLARLRKDLDMPLTQKGKFNRNWNEKEWKMFLDSGYIDGGPKEKMIDSGRYNKVFKPSVSKTSDEEKPADVIKEPDGLPKANMSVDGIKLNDMAEDAINQIMKAILGSVKGGKITIEFTV